MGPNILDTTRHPISSRGVLNWVIWRWTTEPHVPLLVITEPEDSEKMDNRLRVLLAGSRKNLKIAGHNDYVRFGIQSTPILWDEENGEHKEALCLQRTVSKRQRFTEYFSQQGMA